MNKQNTICAIATAPGGALGIIRVSGPEAISIADSIFTPVGSDKRKLQERQPYTLAFGRITDGSGNIIDEVLISIFRAPHSYTGEDSVEISCHGSSYILQQVMQLLMKNGCTPAAPGEYTQRAFLNGKMDLSQAEAVADLIASHSEASHRIAMNQMRGAFSRELAALRSQLLHLTSLMELELDFSDHEELEFADRSELLNVADKIRQTVSSLVGSFRVGNAIKNGVPVAIVGETNAGKSTLLNQLVGEERAIVSDIHGTTRDTIEDTITIGTATFRFIDTAGIRDTTDTIESIGIERTMQKISQAEIVLLLIDSTQASQQYALLAPKVLPLCKGKSMIIVYNKADIVGDTKQPHVTDLTSSEYADLSSVDEILISAKTGQGIDALRHLLCTLAAVDSDSSNGVIVSNLRHLSALNTALADIERVLDGLASGLPSDLISQDLRSCLYALGEITGGEIQTDEVLGNIFSHFCIGK
ncbi:tRNA uridine-5-carboxymethylaminomethyl(34) synthesis GTPase MnmE [uncultured Prevotella sp.]|uniref:tRNA uridine-5-carboxymethylaminomethyl(34) synthesis GTPase MnmE n=1 Tax=uncultured Prevotella sp. TaxID=159272 RepID=UPI00261484E3|nr:tRNA uridine-5-carboxymethylaminomethyl(34) synthesis GTPase MnmE [uncultured Prevotella sp.]